MDNIIFQKNWNDDILISVKITAISKLIKVVIEDVYMYSPDIIKLADDIQKYIDNNEEVYYENFSKDDSKLSRFSIRILPYNTQGHVLIEMEMDIDDNNAYISNKDEIINNAKHTSTFFIETELGLLENFGKNLSKLIDSNKYYEIQLLQNK